MRPDKQIETKLEARNLYFKNSGNKNLKDKYVPEINNVVISEEPTTVINNISPKNLTNNQNGQEIDKKMNNSYNDNKENNNNNDDDTLKIEKVKKIQEKFRSYHLKNQYETQIKPSLSIKTSNFLNKVYAQCSKGGEINDDPNFSIENYKKYYSENDPFFNFDKGKVFKNQTRLKNINDPKNLEIYEGETNFNNLRHGYGVLTTPLFVMKGTWRNDEFTGWGQKLYRNGDIYEGKFMNGVMNGKGILKNKKGNIYIGDFLNNNRCGEGDLTTEKYHYVGEFKKNKFNGKGKIEFLNDGSVYEGDFEDNEIEGKGIYKWKNGDVYEGQMNKGKMHGYGKYKYNDGRIYEGEYSEGKKNGRGKFKYSDDKYYEGIFVDGLPDGEGFYTKDGHTSKVLLCKGEFIKLIA